MDHFESKEGTLYKWEREKESIVDLTPVEYALLKFKVSYMSDEEILNRTSGNGVPMGIPVDISAERLKGILKKLVDVLAEGPLIGFEKHAIERIVNDAILEDGDPQKRGWTSQEEVKGCLLKAKKVTGLRLNVDHEHPANTKKLKHLKPQFAIAILGNKANGKGSLVLVVLKENHISVITVL